MASVSHGVRRAIATLFIDNPPIHALSSSVIEELHKRLEELENHQSTEAVLLMGKNGIFSAGADINEFNQLRLGNTSELELSDLINRLDSFRKPIVAFIQRFAFGGGLELALGCHYRIAESGSKVGLPEVKIGLIPGAQGTQRLPRLIGPRRAMEMVVWGNPIPVEKALEYGVVDKIITPSHDGNMDAVYDFVESLKGKPVPMKRRLSQWKVSIPDNDSIDKIVADARRAMGKQMHGAVAPLYALRAVKAAMKSRSFDLGVQREKELFSEVFTSGQSQALQYAFQASRKAVKLPKFASSAVPMRVTKVSVVGGGTMGRGIVATFLTAGFPVWLLERDAKSADVAEREIHRLVSGARSLGRIKQEGKEGRLRVTTDPAEALSDCDMAVEAVWEDMELKKEVFAMMDEFCPPRAILCSNTSTLDIDEMAKATSRPDQVIGSHFFIPAYHMRPVEIVRGKHVSAETVTTLHSVVRAAGKVPFIVGNCYGFCANRIFFSLLFEAAASLLEGASPKTIDDALETFGLTIGPFKTMDLIGMDVVDLILTNLKRLKKNEAMGHIIQFADIIHHFTHDLGRVGRKSGSGWYQYERPGGKVATPDSEVDRLLEPFRHSSGLNPPIYPERIPNQEIIDRCINNMINEGFKLLEEGIVKDPETIDAMMLQAYGWPQVLGGPMFLASTIGLSKVLGKIEKRYMSFNYDYLKPSELLRKLASTKEPNSLSNWARMGKL